jgi:hypothetical protein
MILRTFQQLAQAYGAVPAQVVVQIDGNTVFSGSIATVDQPMPTLPNQETIIDNVAWTWQDDVAFAGSKSITVSVSNSPLILATTLADNPYNDVTQFEAFYSVDVGNVSYADPFTDETINGVPQSGPYNPDLPGQWWWHIPAGSTFAATMHVQAALPPEPTPEESLP